MIIPKTIYAPTFEKVDPATLPEESAHHIRFEECKTDAELYAHVEEAILAGEFGHIRNRDRIIPYIVYGMLHSPRKIVQYIESNTPPEVAWEMELLGDTTDLRSLTVQSPMLLHTTNRNAKIMMCVTQSLLNGKVTPEEVIEDINTYRNDIDIEDVRTVFRTLHDEGILG